MYFMFRQIFLGHKKPKVQVFLVPSVLEKGHSIWGYTGLGYSALLFPPLSTALPS